ncbi:hypothetical protein CDD83_10437 [Cordyceps sp. RAO-2017]|nr:hypothetical protein CDD83_10437 [Cordyceps sp. RAO-2017]
MKPVKPSSTDAPAHRRSQPVRQTRTNPPRSSANTTRSAAGNGRDSSSAAGSSGNQPIDIFPAITHFADTITALPRELVRHFTLLKEVDAKLFAPEDQVFKLVAAAVNAPLPEPRLSHDLPAISAPAVLQNTSRANAPKSQPSQSVSSADDGGVFDPSNVPRRQLFRQTAFKIQEMLVSLEEKNHVISTANEALQRQLARVEDVWPYLENEFSDEAKWGSATHWAYPENRSIGKASHTERARRDGAAAISAAAQALADEAAARSDARKQAVQAKRNQKNQHHESDAEDHDSRPKGEGSKKAQGSKARKTADGNIGLGISGTSTTNGNPPQKRRKIEKTANGASGGHAMERAMSSVFGNSAPKAKTNSPRGTPVPDVPKKRKALPSGSGQSKKKYLVPSSLSLARALPFYNSIVSLRVGTWLTVLHPDRNGAPRVSPSIASSPVMSALQEPKGTNRASPGPGSAPRPASSRARKNSLQSNADAAKTKAPVPSAGKPNGNAPPTPDLATTSAPSRPAIENKAPKEPSAPVKLEPIKKDGDRAEGSAGPASAAARKEGKADEPERKGESLPPQTQSIGTVTTKSGRASKPSTPALANAQEPIRPRSSRNADGGGGSKKNQKRGNPAVQPQATNVDANNSTRVGDDDEGDIDADEPTYCYCNSVSYGEMVACDAEECEREWFHLACVGLKVAPGSKTKWYCEDCKERLKMGGKKSANR